MSKVKPTTKLCKHCKTDIPYGAKICPNCRKKQGGKAKWIIIGIVALLIIGAAAGGGSDTPTTSGDSEPVKEETTTTEETTAVEYMEISPDDLLTSYEENEVKGDELYEGQMMKITGAVDDIGKDILENVYITFETADEFSITSVQCFFDDETEIEKVMELKPGDSITITGRCDGKFGNVTIKECHIQ